MQIDFSNPWAAIITLGAILAALGVIVKTAVLPVVKASKKVNKRWDSAGEVDEVKEDVVGIKDAVEKILEAIRPTNGDQRSISERVDTAKRAAQEAVEKAEATHNEFTRYQLDESRERQYRQRDHERERGQIISRLSQLEIRQTDLSSRQSSLESKIDAILSKVVEDARE